MGLDENDNKIEENDSKEMNLFGFEAPIMVVIGESKRDDSIFPPINHENLYLSLSSSSSTSSLSSSSSSSFSSSDSEQCSDPETPIRRPADSGWLGWFEALRMRALRLVAVSFGRNGVVCWRGSGVVVALVLVSFWVRARYRRKVRDLVLVVKARDEKISKLLHQIAELNQVLIVRHRALASKIAN